MPPLLRIAVVFPRSRPPLQPSFSRQRAGKPLKTVLNLSTTIDTLHFNHDGQMLVLASRLQRDALR